MDPQVPLRTRLALALVAEAAAFSLPAARGGGWLFLGLIAGTVGLLAAALPLPGPARLRAGLALAFALAARSPALTLLQLLAAAFWLAWPTPRRGTALMGLVAAGLFTPFAEDLARVPPPGPGELTVIFWNTDFPRDPTWGKAAAAAFAPAKPDLVVLAEAGWIPSRGPAEKVSPRFVPLRDGAKVLANALALPHLWSDQVSTLDRHPFHGGCVLLSRHPFEPLTETVPRFPSDPPPAFKVKLPERTLLVSPFHLWSPPHDSLASRRQALDQLLRRLPRRHPRLLAGDTNLLPMDRDDLVAARGFTDPAWNSPYYGGTWPAFFPLARIDAVLASRQLEPVTCRVLAGLGSFHRPVLARFRFSNVDLAGGLTAEAW